MGLHARAQLAAVGEQARRAVEEARLQAAAEVAQIREQAGREVVGGVAHVGKQLQGMAADVGASLHARCRDVQLGLDRPDAIVRGASRLQSEPKERSASPIFVPAVREGHRADAGSCCCLRGEGP